MNYHMIGHTMGSVMLLEALCLVPMALVSLLYGESVFPFLYTIVILAVIALPLMLISQKKRHFLSREGYVTAALSWVVFSLFGALPFLFSGYFNNYIDCLFEAISGFTTTGATVLSDIEALPRGILLWRSTTHFIGGMGILVLATAIMRSDKNRAHYLTKAEMPGPTADKLVPKLTDSSKILYVMYILLTVFEILALLICRLSIYDAVNVAFSTAGTGGFSVMNDSIAGYGSPAVEVVVSIFMLMFAVNFTVYFLFLTGRSKLAVRNDEFRFFLLIVVLSVLITTLLTVSAAGSAGTALRQALFTVAATISTTGFVVVDYDTLWPAAAKSVIILLMLVGACAGSTGGGIKCSRILVLLKSVVREIKHIIHPRAVTSIRMDDSSVAESTLFGILHFFAAYIGISLIGLLLVSVDNHDFTTTFISVISCMGNVGPALGLAGPVCNYAFYSIFSKLVLSLLMLIGRLEIFPILILLSPSTWRRN